jgi:serine/threonine protein kinase/Tol biopolymer transport system component
MALSPGTRLGPYEILALIGSGGMGEVYGARDTRLDRTVAIKILPSADPELKARFEREAKAIASLQHPHICTLHDVGHQNGTDYLVMEHLQGETLAARIARGRIKLDEALKIAIEIADALDKAHRAGIAHRDLKPGNIMLTRDGVKLLDFGLAKLAPASPAHSTGFSGTATQASPLTAHGTILGTLHYMSPEQVEGRDADARSDIFALGAIVYEMVTGTRAFEGKSPASVIAAILEREPSPISTLQPLVPVQLDHIVKECLAKDPDARWQSVSDVMRELKWVARRSPETGNAPHVSPIGVTHPLWLAALAVAAGLLVGAVVTKVVGPGGSSKSSGDVARLLVGVGPADQLPPPRPSRTAMAFSPDGKYLVFVAVRNSRQQLYLRALDRLEATPIAGTEDGDSPFFSPDGRWVGFWSGVNVDAVGDLKKVPLTGGPAVTVCRTPALFGASWGSNDAIVFANIGGGLWAVPAGGGTPKPLTTVDIKKGEVSHRLPHVLPDSKAVLFTALKASRRWDDAEIIVRSLLTGEQKVLVTGGADARYVTTGHVIYARTGTLMAVPFDLGRLQITGSPYGIVEDLMQSVNSVNANLDVGAAQFSVSGSGSLVYLPGGIFPDLERTLAWVDRKGELEPLAAPARSYFAPRLSPDGQRLVVYTAGLNPMLWTYDLSRGTLTRLTVEGQSRLAIWTPDGKRVTFRSSQAGPENLFWKPADGSGVAERLTTSENNQTPASWSPDGKSLLFLEEVSPTNMDICALSMEGGHVTAPYCHQTPFLERWADFSPDGHWLTYVSNETGRDEVYVQAYPDGPKFQVSTDGGTQPAWARNGRELFYIIGATAASTRMMVVDVTLAPTFSASIPRMLFEGRFGTTTPIRGYDVSADGRRFLMIQPKEQPPERPITQMVVVLNWTEELKAHVSTK